MSKRREIDLTAGVDRECRRRVRAPRRREHVAGVDDHRVVRARGGERDSDGMGEIRIYKRGRTTGRDEIVELVPGRRFAYRALSGLPTA